MVRVIPRPHGEPAEGSGRVHTAMEGVPPTSLVQLFMGFWAWAGGAAQVGGLPRVAEAAGVGKGSM